MGYWSRKNSHDAAWEYLIDELQPDIALVQESRPPTSYLLDGRLIWHQILEKGEWGSGIYSKNNPMREIDFDNSYPGALVGAIVTLPNNKKMTAFSLYGQLEKKYGATGYATTSVQKMISDLTWILMGNGSFKELNENLVLGGDFNVSVQCDIEQQNTNKGTYLNAHRLVFERICDFGLHSVYDWSGKEGFVQTHRHKTSKKPWQNDYIFLSQKLHEETTGRKILDDKEKILKLSDHNPVMVDINI